MKFYVEYSHAGGRTDGVSWGQLLQHMPLTTNLAEADAVIILVVWVAGYQFNHGLNRHVGKKPIIILDYLEYGWDWAHDQDNVLGRGNCVPCSNTDNGNWGTLNLFIREANPILQFKRELRKQDAGPTVVPIEFLAHLPKQALQSKAEFDARPLDVFNCWGFTHPSRARAHADMMRLFADDKINLIDGYGKMINVPKGSWLSVNTPAHLRKPMKEILRYQSMAKISLSFYGAGRKCFRHGEAPENCIMAHQEDGMEWSYPWDDNNSIVVNEPTEVERILAATKWEELYDLYVASQQNLDNYRLESYLPNWVMANIQRVL